ncbi:MAG: NUDIX hydrolase [Candidatus Syntropharchaeia archaeon]
MTTHRGDPPSFISHEKTIKREYIHRGRVLTLRIDDVELPDGRRSHREIIDHPGAVAVLAFLDERKILLVKQFRKAIEEITLEIPAGVLERGEDPAHCARRELEEETGFKAKKIKKMLEYYPSPGFTNEVIHIFFASELEKTEKKEKFLKPVPMEIDEAIALIKEGKIRDGKTIIGLILAKFLKKI